MKNVILFDNETREQLLPLTYTRPVCEIRVGILTIREKWERWLEADATYITHDYLAEKYGIDYSEENYVINGSVLPSAQLCALINQMNYNEAFLHNNELIVAKLDARQLEKLIKDDDIEELKGLDLEDTDFVKLNNLWDIFQLNDRAVKEDFELLTKGRKSQPIPDSNRVVAPEAIFIEEGAQVEFATLNAKTGPIYIGANAEVMEGSLIRGSTAICENAIVKMGSQIYGPTTIGPGSKVGGEISNVVIQAFSNKSHGGFLGNSVIGEWCNIGADANSSNLKNNYQEVKVWNYPKGEFINSGTQFCGIFMGDHSKVGINTMLRTGTVIGVSANLFGAGFPRSFIPSFSWGGPHGYTTFKIEKAFETAELMMQRRNQKFVTQERLILLRVYEDTAKYRSWEKT